MHEQSGQVEALSPSSLATYETADLVLAKAPVKNKMLAMVPKEVDFDNGSMVVFSGTGLSLHVKEAFDCRVR